MVHKLSFVSYQVNDYCRDVSTKKGGEDEAVVREKRKGRRLGGNHSCPRFFSHRASTLVSAGLPSRGGDVAVYVFDINQPSLFTPFFPILFLCLFCLYGPLNCISIHKFSRRFSVFSLCSCGLSTALLVLSTICLSMKVSFSPDIIPSG